MFLAVLTNTLYKTMAYEKGIILPHASCPDLPRFAGF
jgi:hypothetical protein